MADDALRDELLLVDVAECRAIGDFLGDRWLGECRLVGLVVALATVTIHVDDDVALELLAELESKYRCPVKFHRLLPVHMENRRFDHLRHIRRIGGRTRVGRNGGETDLVIDNQVDRATGAIPFELRKIEHFRDRSLTGECGIAVHQNRQHLLAVNLTAAFAQHALAGAGFTFHNGVDGFQVARIGRQTDADLAIVEFTDAFVAEVVFHVAIASDEVGLIVGRELVEDRGERLSDKVGEDVHPPAVRHAHFDLLDTV